MCTASNRKNILSSSSSNSAPIYDGSNLMLPIDFTPGPKDILCGRGNVFAGHAGNRCFNELVHAGLDAYREAPDRPSKIRVVDGISRALRSRGFRFAKLGGKAGDGKDGAKRWRELSDVQAHQKIGHAIRDTIRLINKNSNRKSKSGNGRRKPMSQLSNNNANSNINNNNKSALKRKRRSSLRSMWFDAASMAPIVTAMTSTPMTTDEILERSIETSTVWPLDQEQQEHQHQQQQQKHYFTAANEFEVPSLPPRKRLERISSGASSLKSIGSLFLLPNEYPDENCDFTAGCFFEDYRIASQ